MTRPLKIGVSDTTIFIGEQMLRMDMLAPKNHPLRKIDAAEFSLSGETDAVRREKEEQSPQAVFHTGKGSVYSSWTFARPLTVHLTGGYAYAVSVSRERKV